MPRNSTKNHAKKTSGRILGALAGLLVAASSGKAGAIRKVDLKPPSYRVDHPFSRRETIHPARISIDRAEIRAAWIANHANTLEWDFRAKDSRAVVPRWVQLQSFNGLLPRTPLVQYLEWRRGLDRIRFDRYHPQWVPQLARDESIRTAGLPNPLPIVANIPPRAPETIRTLGFPVTPQPQFLTTPEPSSGAVLAILAGTSAFVSRWKFKKNALDSSVRKYPE